MRVETLEYLSALDSPSMIVRYCHPARMVHWMWVSNVFATMGHPDTETVTINFDERDAWTETSSMEIRRTLEVYRTIRLAPRRTPIGLTVDNEGLDLHTAFELNHAVSSIRDGTRLVTTDDDPRLCLPVKVWVDGDTMYAAIDVVSSIGVALNTVTRGEMMGQLAYVLAYMAGSYDFVAAARDLVRFILNHKIEINSRHIVASVAILALETPDIAAEVASLNKLHTRQDEAYVRYLNQLVGSELPVGTRAAATERFYREAIEAHEQYSDERCAVLHYSLANFLQHVEDHVAAIRHYNSARKMHPEYMQKDYFLAEVGSSLYFRRRFRMSAHFYSTSFHVTPNAKAALCAGDAHLFSGQLDEADPFYCFANHSGDDVAVRDSALKAWMIRRLLELPVTERDRTGSAEAWCDLAGRFASENRPQDEFLASAMCAFLEEGNPQLWVRAIWAAIGTGDRYILTATLSCAVWRCGLDAYTPLRDLMVAEGAPAELVQNIDAVATQILSLRTKTDDDVIVGRFKGHHFDIAMEVDPENGR